MPKVARNITPTPTSLGTAGIQLDLSVDRSVPAQCKAVFLLTDGVVVYRPVNNADADYITTGTLRAGTILPHVVGVVRSTANGTTATVCTVEDAG